MPGERPPSPAHEDRSWVAVRCSRCGEEFRCGAGTPRCWCDAVVLTPERRTRITELGLEGCLCRACLEAV